MADIKMPGLIGKKLGMTHVFAEDGRAVPVTVVEAGPCKITQVKTKERDGYDALQIGYGPAKESRVNKPLKGHFAAAGTEPFKLVREFRVDDATGYSVGIGLTVSAFEAGAKVDIVGTSIGKGFAGVVKRHGFHGGPETHGSKSHDVPGSIGGSAYPGRVWPGQKLPGRTGGAKVTVKKILVVGVDPDRNLLLLKGAVPGKRNSIVTLRPSAGFEPALVAEDKPEEAAEPVDAGAVEAPESGAETVREQNAQEKAASAQGESGYETPDKAEPEDEADAPERGKDESVGPDEAGEDKRGKTDG